MLLIWGLRMYFRTIGQGTFHCPNCGGDRQYRLRSGRRWFHLFFIPIIPLGAASQHAQCGVCRTRYHVDVLKLPTAAQMQAAIPAGLRAGAVVMLRAGDPASPASRQRAIQAIIAGGVEGYDAAALDADLTRPAEAVAGDVAQVGAQLAVHAREWFLAEMVRIAMADGGLTDAEREAALGVGMTLGMTQAQVLGVVALAEQAATSE